MIHNTVNRRNQNPHFTSLVRKGEAKIREFAKRYELPIVEIDGIIRPVLGSGLWNPFFFLIDRDDDRDDFDLDVSVGFGHRVGPDERSTAIAAEWLAGLDWSDESDREWTHPCQIKDQLKCRPGALILAANLLGIDIRHFDACMIDVEVLIPSKSFQPQKRLRASSKRLPKGKSNG